MKHERIHHFTPPTPIIPNSSFSSSILGLIMESWLTWNSLCGPGWPQNSDIHSLLPQECSDVFSVLFFSSNPLSSISAANKHIGVGPPTGAQTATAYPQEHRQPTCPRPHPKLASSSADNHSC